MGIMAYSLLRTMQDLYHQPKGLGDPSQGSLMGLGFRGLGV